MVALRVGDLFIAFSTSSEALWGDVFPDLYGALSSKRWQRLVTRLNFVSNYHSAWSMHPVYSRKFIIILCHCKWNTFPNNICTSSETNPTHSQSFVNYTFMVFNQCIQFARWFVLHCQWQNGHEELRQYSIKRPSFFCHKLLLQSKHISEQPQETTGQQPFLHWQQLMDDIFLTNSCNRRLNDHLAFVDCLNP